MDAWVILTMIFSFMMAFSIGSNDAANGLGTSYGTKALPLGYIITNGALAEFVGAMFLSNAVATTLSEDIVPALHEEAVIDQKKMMLSVCVVTFVFVMGSSYAAKPVSGTHAVIGALLGAGAVTKGVADLAWGRMLWIVLSWFVSPTFAALLSYLIMGYVARFTMQTKTVSYGTRLLMLQGVGGFCFVMMFYLADKILNVPTTVYDKVSEPKIIPPNYWGFEHHEYLMILLFIAFTIGVLVTRLLFFAHLVALKNDNSIDLPKTKLFFNIVFLPMSTSMIEELTLTIKIVDVEEDTEDKSRAINNDKIDSVIWISQSVTIDRIK